MSKDYTMIMNPVRFLETHHCIHSLPLLDRFVDIDIEIRQRTWSSDLLVIMKSRLPLYHIKIASFQPSFCKRNTGLIMSNLVSSESSKSTL